MFDVLVYLYENYWRPDACPEPKQLSRKLSAVGFDNDEIQDALRWLDGLANSTEGWAIGGGEAKVTSCGSQPVRAITASAISRMVGAMPVAMFTVVLL